MKGETNERAMAVRHAAGEWYVLTPETLHSAKASAAQRAEPEAQLDGDVRGFSIIVHDLGTASLSGNYAQLGGNYLTVAPLGGLTLPAGAPSPSAQGQSIIIDQ